MAFLDLKSGKPIPHSEFRGVKKMGWRFMQRLEKCGVNGDGPRRLEDTKNLSRCLARPAQMLEDIEGENPVEHIVAKRESMRVPYDIGMPENFVLEFDAV